MGILVNVRALDCDVLIELNGASHAQIARLLDAWEWCGGRRVAHGKAGPVVRIRATLQPAPGERAQPRQGDSAEVFSASTWEELAERVTSLVTAAAIEARRSELLMFHASAVAAPSSGATVAMIGPSGRGKSTAVAALLQHFAYVTDETVGVRADLSIAPYPKPVSLRSARTNAWKDQIPPRELAVAGPESRPWLSSLVLLDRVAGPSPRIAPSVSVHPLREVLGDLLPQVSHLASIESPLRRLADTLDAVGGVRRVVYSEAADLVPVMRSLVEGARPREACRAYESAPPRRPQAVAASRPHADDPAPSGAVARSAAQDELDEGDATIVLIDGTVTMLEGVGPTIWRTTATPVPESAVIDAVVEGHGLPDRSSAEDAVREAISALRDAGVLR